MCPIVLTFWHMRRKADLVGVEYFGHKAKFALGNVFLL